MVITGRRATPSAAGMDLKERWFSTALKDQPARYDKVDQARDRMAAVARCDTFPKPTIAMINGYCFGRGLFHRGRLRPSRSPRRRRHSVSPRSILKGFPGGAVSKVACQPAAVRVTLLLYAHDRPPLRWQDRGRASASREFCRFPPARLLREGKR